MENGRKLLYYFYSIYIPLTEFLYNFLFQPLQGMSESRVGLQAGTNGYSFGQTHPAISLPFLFCFVFCLPHVRKSLGCVILGN